jgi:hypothetical protein
MKSHLKKRLQKRQEKEEDSFNQIEEVNPESENKS